MRADAGVLTSIAVVSLSLSPGIAIVPALIIEV